MIEHTQNVLDDLSVIRKMKTIMEAEGTFARCAQGGMPQLGFGRDLEV